MKKISVLEDIGWPRALTRLDEQPVNNNRKMAVGTVVATAVMTDPHIKKLINYVSKQTKIPVTEVEDVIDEQLQGIKQQHLRSPLLFGTMVGTALEAAVFRLFQPAGLKKKNDGRSKYHHFPVVDVSTAPVFDNVVFSALIRRIKAEHPSIFPLRNLFKKKPLAAPRIILIPNKDAETMKTFGDIDTAAATPKGEFIFNVDFMQQCMNFSHVRGVKPKGKKYKSNGGTFPDEYAMLEFLILHEFYHYTQGDFHYQKVLKSSIDGKSAKGKIINWVGDFRTNYDLVKAGFEPIPLGLYNELINFDRQKTYKEMYDLVEKEMEKLKTPNVGDVFLDRKKGGYHVVTSVDLINGKVTARPATDKDLEGFGVKK